MNDVTLALMGVSAGIGYAVATVIHPRYLRWKRKIRYPDVLTREVYKSLDEVTGASKEINQQRADRRRAVIEPRGRWSWFKRMVPRDWRTWYANYRWPVPRSELGTAPLPPLEVMSTYVWMGEHRYDWFIRFTSEAASSRDVFLDYLFRGHPTKGGGLCQALGLEYTGPEMFRVTWDRPNHVIRLTLREQDQDQAPARPPMDVRSST